MTEKPTPTVLDTAVSNPEEGKSFIDIGGVSCVVRNDDYFRKVRNYFDLEDSFAAETFKFSDMRPSSGKGGNPMCPTSDGLCYIKELSKDDHKTLENTKFAKALCHHVTKPPSLLDPILAHFLNPETGNYYIAMLNVLRYKGKWEKMYDLKGCADDRLIISEGEKLPVVRKRFYKLHMWVKPAGRNRKTYKSGKLEALHEPYLPISLEGKEQVMAAIERDTKFLTKHGLMDYSLLVGVTKGAEAPCEDISQAPIYAGKPFRAHDEESETYI